MTDADPTYITDDAAGESWRLMLGDSCERLAEVDTDSIDLAIYSPPFASLFVYSPSLRDLGNSSSREEFFRHYQFIIGEMLRVTKPGRINAVHVQQLTTTKSVHGIVGLTDFRGEVIRAYQDAGWIFHGEVTIDKDPQALRHGQRVLTPAGWVPIESLTVGDSVIGSDGHATKVEGVWPQGVGQVFRVTFSDGAAVECDGAHLWNVRNAADQRNSRWRTVRTADLIAGGVLSPSGRTRYEVPLVAPVQFAMAEPLPLHPYVIGSLLGDGNVTQRASVSLTTQRAIAARVGSLLPDGHTIREQAGTAKGDDTATFHVGHPDWHRNDVLAALRVLGIQGQRAWEKRVPAAYLVASVDDRRELLAGLLDTDGTVKQSGSVWFGTTSEGLALDVVALVQSLGGIAKVRRETTRRYVYGGEVRNGRPMWLVCIELDGEPLVTLPRKVERWRSTRRRWSRRIVSIEPVGTDERTCITVAADDGMFVTEGHVVTHNSQAIRTKAQALMFVQKNKDSSKSRPALADYLLLFRKPGEIETPIKTDITNDEWIKWARPIWQGTDDAGNLAALESEGLVVPHSCWYGIRESNTLNVAAGRDSDDERHICPLQLDLIDPAIRLWSNPGETVLSPFAGIGSEGYVSVKLGRRFTGCELKPSYWTAAVANLKRAEQSAGELTLFDPVEA